MNTLTTIIVGIAVFALGIVIGKLVLGPKKAAELRDFEKQANKLLETSRLEAETILKQSQQRIEEMQKYMIEHEAKNKAQTERLENLITSKEAQVSEKEVKLLEIKTAIENEQIQVTQMEQQIKSAEAEMIQKLAVKSGSTVDETKSELLNELDRDLELERETRLAKYENHLKEEKVRIAKNAITNVIQRYSAPTSVEKKSSAITVNRDEQKGKLIGREAENILLIEELTGVDIIFNDSPDTIIISCFDLVKRHIARETIVKLLKEKIITLEKVRTKLAEVEKETDRLLIGIGRDTVRMLKLEYRNFPPDFMKTIGRLKFRTSYGQNILKHSFEVGYFTLMLGGELNLDMTTSKIGGFFHDLGKAIDQEVGGSHDVLTKEIMEKYTFSEDEIHAAWAHHDAVPQRTAEAMLVKAGDAISAGRPGARQESLEKYVERIQAIEGIAGSYEGVSKAFAISAGREVRVLVEPQHIKDEDLKDLAINIAEEIQGNVAYPGKIKVNIIRRTKNVDYAK